MTTSTSDTGSSSPAPKKKKLLKWALIVGGGGVAAVGLLVLVTPTLLSTGAGKSFVVGKINASLKGKIEIESWSLGWFSPISVTGVKVYDDQNRLAVTVPSVKTGLTVLSAARGNLDLGEVVIESPNLVLFEMRKDGTDNLSTLAGPSDPNAVFVIPDIRGNVTIRNLTATVEGAAIGTPIRVDSSDLSVKIPSLANAPITADVKLVVRRDNTAPGTITVKGDAQAIFAGVVDVNKLTANQVVTLSGVDLGTVSPFLAASGVSLAGVAEGSITANVKGLDAADVSGELRVKNLVAGGEALKGDSFKTALLTVPMKVSTTKGSDGTPLVKIEKLGVESAEVSVGVAGEVSQGALEKVGAMKGPGMPGSLKVSVRVPDVAVIAGQLRNTMALGEGVTVTGGSVMADVDVVLGAMSAGVKGQTKIEGIRGTSAGKAISLDPVVAGWDVRADYTDKGMSWLTVTSADLTSAFAKAGAKGTLEDMTYAAEVDLGVLRRQLGQFVDFGAAEFSGRLVSGGSLKGNLLAATGDVTATTKTELTGVRVALPATADSAGMSLDVDRLLAEGEATLKSKGEVRFGVAEVKRLVVEAGPSANPLVAVNATATADLVTSDVPAFDVSKLDINSLPDASRRYGALVPALKEMGLEFPTGVARVSMAGSFVGGNLVLTKPMRAQLADVSVVREGRRVIWRDTIGVTAAGTVATVPALKAEMSQLDVTSTSGLVSVKQVGEKLLFEVRADGTAGGTGEVMFGADLAGVARAGAAWTGTPQAQEITSGRAAGSLKLSDTGTGPSSVNVAVDLTGLTVGNTLSNENVTLLASATSPDRFKTLAAAADVTSRFAVVALRDTAVSLAAPGVWEMLTSATLTVKADDLAKVDSLLKALSPPVAPVAGQPVPPVVNVTSGSLATEMKVSRQGTTTTVNIATLQAKNIGLRAGNASYRVPKDVDLKGQMTLDASTAGGATPAAQIKQLSVTELAGSVGVADIAVSQPIVVTDLAGTSPVVKGAVQVTGRIQTVTGLLEVLQGAAPGTLYPYVGDFALEQKLATDQGMMSAAGTVRVNNLKLLDARGNPSFSEDRLEVANDLSYSAAGGGEVRLRNLAVNMASSNAVAVKATGVIRDLSNTCTFAEPLRVQLGYDLEKLFPLIVPMLAPETQKSLAGAVVTGKYDREFVVSGSYPMTAAPEVAIKSLVVTGGVGVAGAKVPGYGLDLTGFEPNFDMKQGVLTVAMAKPAGLNGGRLSVAGTAVDLGQTTPRLSMPDNHVLIEGVALNRVIADQMGRVLGPLFVQTDQASGLLKVTFVKCDRLPLGELATQPVAANDGMTEFTINIADLQLIGGFAGDFIRNIPGMGGLFVGNVTNAKFVVKNGVVTQDLPITLGKGVTGDIRFSGNIELAPPQRLNPLQVRVGSALLRDKIPFVKDVVKLADPVFVIKGTVSEPKLDFAKGIEQWVKDQAGGILPGLLGGGGQQGGGQPADKSGQTPPPAKEDPLGNLLKGLGGGKDKKPKP